MLRYQWKEKVTKMGGGFIPYLSLYYNTSFLPSPSLKIQTISPWVMVIYHLKKKVVKTK
jgi:hypothetical protein